MPRVPTSSQKEIVIVGAGSAGCVLANRLSADPDNAVTLLESGPDYFPGPTPPDLRRAGRNSFTAHDWGYSHIPNAIAPRYPLPRGRVVGGSSAVNTCIALRGQPLDFEEWAALGLDEWGWDGCLRAYKKLEHDLDFDNDWHGTRGPLPIRRHPEREWTPWHRAFVEACVKLGYPECPDTNEPDTVGVGAHAMNKVAGRRVSAADAWLDASIRSRPNFDLRPESHVHRIEFDGLRATGVEIDDGEKMESVYADEIILCAGALNTPGILLRSGVGAPEDLARIGVDVAIESPHVCRRLLDHPGTALFFLPKLFSGTSRRHDMIQTVCRFSSGANDFCNDLIMQAGASVPIPWGGEFPLVSLMFQLGKPRGVGSIRYESADPHAEPIVESRLFEDPADMETALDAYERLWELANTEPLVAMARPVWPPRFIARTRSRLRRLLPRVSDSGYHPSGTVPMAANPADGACDPEGRIYGAENLRVADASLMPTIPTANIHLTVLMMAERIAECMLGD